MNWLENGDILSSIGEFLFCPKTLVRNPQDYGQAQESCKHGSTDAHNRLAISDLRFTATNCTIRIASF